MRFSEFESKYPDLLAASNPATVRKWRQRDRVPDSVTKGVTKRPESVTSVTKSVTSQDPFEILADGWARGYPGDSPLMRARYRTAHAIARRYPDRGRELCERYAATGELPKGMQKKIPRPD